MTDNVGGGGGERKGTEQKNDPGEEEAVIEEGLIFGEDVARPVASQWREKGTQVLTLTGCTYMKMFHISLPIYTIILLSIQVRQEISDSGLTRTARNFGLANNLPPASISLSPCELLV